MKFKGYIGTYSVRDSHGIYHFEADSKTGVLKILDAYPAVNPSYLAISNRTLFAVFECGEYHGEYGGAVASYAINPDGSLSLISVKRTLGKDPCHVCLEPCAKRLYVSNYGDGTLSVFGLERGVLSEASIIRHHGNGPDKGRQNGPHIHCAQINPKTNRLYVVDLGIDRIVIYNADDMSVFGSLEMDPGSGPRHIVFSKHRCLAWVACEMGNVVNAFDTQNGRKIGTYPTLPQGFNDPSICAAIKLSPDEERLYVSNRGHDSITCYDIDKDTGRLSRFAICPSGGQTPRDFSISPDGSYLYVANQKSDSVNVFRLEGGLPVGTGLSLSVPSPVCLVFYDG